MDIKPTVAPLNNGINSAGGSKPAKTESDASASTAKPAQGFVDDLSLTSTAQQLIELQTSLEQLTDVDLAKVEAIRQEIASGTYQVDAGKIADKLVESSLELP